MKYSILAALSAMLICMLIPYAAARRVYFRQETPQPVALTASATETTEAAFFEPEVEKALGYDEQNRIAVLCSGKTVMMNMHTYLVGALLGEMPMRFSEQALCAQAVACRTYALRQAQANKHGQAAVCTDSSCCMSWVEPAQYEKQNGAQLLKKAEQAVTETDGVVLTYKDKLIDATFFSCSGGTTESALAVWGTDVEYLQSVESPGEDGASHNTDTLTFSLQEFRQILSQADAEVKFSGKQSWIGQTTYEQSGSVKTMQLGGRTFTGVQLRRLFGLYSTRFELTITDNAVFTTHGYGHRVGMSQYGADAMARQGSSWQEILAWYYRGAEQKQLP